MEPKSQRPKHRDATLSSLNAAIKFMNILEEASDITSVKAVFGSVSATLAMIRVGLLSSALIKCNLIYTGFHDQ